MALGENVWEILFYALLLVAFALPDIKQLRFMAILAALSTLSHLYLVGVASWPLLIWIALAVGINGYYIIKMKKLEGGHDSYHDSDKKFLYQMVFHRFSPTQFKRLIDRGEFAQAAVGENLTVRGEPVNYVSVIISGMTDICVDGEVIAHCTAGDLIGEMSFISGGGATATVQVTEPLRYVRWRKSDLQGLLEEDPGIQKAMITVFNKDLVRKLGQQAYISGLLS